MQMNFKFNGGISLGTLFYSEQLLGKEIMEKKVHTLKRQKPW